MGFFVVHLVLFVLLLVCTSLPADLSGFRLLLFAVSGYVSRLSHGCLAHGDDWVWDMELESEEQKEVLHVQSRETHLGQSAIQR